MKHPQTNEEFDEKWDSRYKERVENSHTSPSPETKARLKALEDNQKLFMEKMNNLEEKIDDIRVKLTSLPKEIFDEADKRYASKLVERGFYAFIGAISLAVIYALLEVVIK